MDVDSEINLFSHIDFVPATFTSDGKSSKRMRGSVYEQTTQNSKQNPKNNKKQSKVHFAILVSQVFRTFTFFSILQPKSSKKRSRPMFKLGTEELLFFSKNYNPTPMPSTTDVSDDSVKKRNYIAKIGNMSTQEIRMLRSQHDVRYLNKPKAKCKETEDEQQFCHDHLVGRCKSSAECGRWHQLRQPRYFGVCKYYIAGCCKNGDLCQFMHEDFPCRFYFLDLDHPKKMDKDNCRFRHGGPLPRRLYFYFQKQIEMWVKEMCKETPEQFDNMLSDYIEKYETKHAKLEKEYGIKSNKSSTVTSNDAQFSVESILTASQILALAEKNITTAAQISKVTVDDLIDLGLTIDQVYTIITNTSNESDQSRVVCEDVAEENKNYHITMSDIMLDSPPNVLNSSNDVNFEKATFNVDLEVHDVPFSGFAQIQLQEAEYILQTTRRICQIGREAKAETLIFSNEIRTKLEYASEVKVDLVDQTQTVNSDSYEDSDSELGLVINEDL